MADLTGPVGELRFTLEVTRANGNKETLDLVGFVDPADLERYQAAQAAEGESPCP